MRKSSCAVWTSLAVMTWFCAACEGDATAPRGSLEPAPPATTAPTPGNNDTNGAGSTSSSSAARRSDEAARDDRFDSIRPSTTTPAPDPSTPSPPVVDPIAPEPAPVACVPPTGLRGTVETVYSATATDPPVTSIAMVGDTLYLANLGDENGGAGWLRRCSPNACSATKEEVALPATVQRPFSLTPSTTGAFVYDRSGELFSIDDGASAPKSLGPVLDSFFSQKYGGIAVTGSAERMIVSGRRPANHGVWQDAALVENGSPAKVTKRYDGGELSGWDGFATPTRLFVRGFTYWAGDVLSVLDPSTGLATAYLSTKYVGGTHLVRQSFVFAFGERVGAIEIVEGNGVATRRTAICESDTVCALPIRFGSTTLPGKGYVGTVGDELVFWLPITDAPGSALASCTRTQLTSGACVPTFVACDAPLPASSATTSNATATDGTWLYYVAADQSVMRVHL